MNDYPVVKEFGNLLLLEDRNGMGINFYKKDLEKAFSVIKEKPKLVIISSCMSE